MKNKMLEIIHTQDAQGIINNAQSATFRKYFSESSITQMKVIYADIMLNDDPSYNRMERWADAMSRVREYANSVIVK